MKKLVTPTGAWVVGISRTIILRNASVSAFCASWLIALAAQISIPFCPIPMTMQTFAIALVGLLTPWPTAMGTVLLYLGYAVVGFPVSASGSIGLSVFTGPTGGFLVGMVLMSGVIAAFAQRYQDSGILMRFGFTLVGGLCMFMLGLWWLIHLFSWQVALKVGLLPFVFVEPIKLALAAYLSVFIQNRYLDNTR